MKTITFFNEKGGVGKSTLAIMYASWLHYKFGKAVTVVDLNNRIESYRRDELEEKKSLGTAGNYDMEAIWPILAPRREDMEKFKGQKIPYSMWLDDQIKGGAMKGADVAIIDLPGSGSGKEYSSMLLGRHIGLYIIPTDRDAMTMRATLAVSNTLKVYGKGEVYAVFINQVQSYVAMKEYEKVAELLKKRVPVLPDLISYSERLKTLSKVDIIKSTLEYPDFSAKAFDGSRDLGLENLFIDVTRLLEKTPDHRNTGAADLGFVHGLKKEFKDRRTLMHSSFPEFDFPEEMFPKSRRSKKEDSEME